MMRFLKPAIGLVVLTTASSAIANDIPDLQSSIANLTGAELSSFESQIGETAITETFDVAIETAIESGASDMPAGLVPELSAGLVSEALSEGFITESEAADLTTTLDLYQANEKYFDFNFAETIAAALAANALTASEAAEMMSAFNRLSEAGKTAVGSESFNFEYNQADMQALGEADQRIICSIDCGNSKPSGW
jgi:hypothetical protein